MRNISTPEQINSLKGLIFGRILSSVVAKSTTERQNSNNLHLANSSTPFNRAFFVRSTRTPKERLKMACSSMVACNGKGSPFAVFQVSQFLTPLHAIAQIVRSLAIAPKKSYLELSTMITLPQDYPKGSNANAFPTVISSRITGVKYA